MKNQENQVLSIKQMQELIKLGIDTSKASMCWYVPFYSGIPELVFNNKLNSSFEGAIPTFTLQDILKIIKEKVLEKDLSLDLELDLINNQFQLTKEVDYRLYTTDGKTLLKSAFQMLKWCKKNQYI